MPRRHCSARVGLVSNKLDPDESVGLDAVGPSNIQSLSKISLSGLDTLWIPMVTKRDLMDIPVYRWLSHYSKASISYFGYSETIPSGYSQGSVERQADTEYGH